ncbi:MAG: NAD(P)/FAD-dependent oxidoreductase [Bacteroidetes bacterium]|nr:NAD(P)/FAD-dependent oxidoreductase [Bacteroidota bacterium]
MKKKVVVLGGGFAGLQFCRSLNKKIFDITLIDRQNHHQFQPLFYQVAASQIEPANISFPLRSVFRNQPQVQIRMAEVKTVDTTSRTVKTTAGDFSFDILVLATGCRTNFFGNEALARHALTLKTTADAIRIRNHILSLFERMVVAPPDEQEHLCNIVIAGAGPTGVELAGAFAEIRRDVLPRDFPGVDFSKLTVYLVEGSPDTLAAMSEASRTESRRYLEGLGVTVKTGTMVKTFDGRTVFFQDGSSIRTETLIWAAGVIANRPEGLPEANKAPGNRVRVNRLNQVEGTNQIFALGDLAYMETPKYPKGHPQVANVALSQARFLAKNLEKLEKGHRAGEFEYRDLGSMATIGKHKAVVDFPFLHVKGYPAWLIWMFLHLMLILSVKNKLLIFINWAWNYVSYDSSLRLIFTAPETKKANDSP